MSSDSLPAGKYVAIDRKGNPIIVTVFEHAIKTAPQVFTAEFPDGTTKTIVKAKQRQAILEQISDQSKPPPPLKSPTRNRRR